MSLLAALKKLRDEGLDYPNLGICAHVIPRQNEFLRLATGWPKHSGDYQYPIPGVDGRTPEVAYNSFWGKEQKWNPDHPYGALRLELLNWCIEQLERQERETL